MQDTSVYLDDYVYSATFPRTGMFGASCYNYTVCFIHLSIYITLKGTMHNTYPYSFESLQLLFSVHPSDSTASEDRSVQTKSQSPREVPYVCMYVHVHATQSASSFFSPCLQVSLALLQTTNKQLISFSP